MSTPSSGRTPAHVAFEQYLSNNPGWHEVSEIASGTGYSHTHTLKGCKALDQDPNSKVEGRKNQDKRVMGYIINGDLEVPGDDRQRIINLIQRHSSSPPSMSGMALDQLYSHLRHNVASGVVPLEAKWEFRIP